MYIPNMRVIGAGSRGGGVGGGGREDYFMNDLQELEGLLRPFLQHLQCQVLLITFCA